ncbi:DNA repair protein RecO [Thiolapillus sp.]
MPVPEPSPAYVLHARKYGEVHLILDVFTHEAGRLPLMARGAASSRSVRRGLLQPFIPLLIAWSGKGSIANLRQVEARGTSVNLLGTALFSGFYINELTQRLLGEHEPVPELFVAYEQCLRLLAQTDGSEIDTALRQYELSLLRVLGYGVDLETEANTGKPVSAHEVYSYQIECGLRHASDGDSLRIGGATLLALAKGEGMDRRQRQEARQLMRHVIGYYLGDRPLRSRELFQSQHNQENH